MLLRCGPLASTAIAADISGNQRTKKILCDRSSGVNLADATGRESAGTGPWRSVAAARRAKNSCAGWRTPVTRSARGGDEVGYGFRIEKELENNQRPLGALRAETLPRKFSVAGGRLGSKRIVVGRGVFVRSSSVLGIGTFRER
jgi:hypothetical protein